MNNITSFFSYISSFTAEPVQQDVDIWDSYVEDSMNFMGKTASNVELNVSVPENSNNLSLALVPINRKVVKEKKLFLNDPFNFINKFIYNEKLTNKLLPVFSFTNVISLVIPKQNRVKKATLPPVLAIENKPADSNIQKQAGTFSNFLDERYQAPSVEIDSDFHQLSVEIVRLILPTAGRHIATAHQVATFAGRVTLQAVPVAIEMKNSCFGLVDLGESCFNIIADWSEKLGFRKIHRLEADREISNTDKKILDIAEKAEKIFDDGFITGTLQGVLEEGKKHLITELNTSEAGLRSFLEEIIPKLQARSSEKSKEKLLKPMKKEIEDLFGKGILDTFLESLKTASAQKNIPEIEAKKGYLMTMIRVADSVIAAVANFFHNVAVFVRLREEQKLFVGPIFRTEVEKTNHMIRKCIENIDFVATVIRQAPFIGRKLTDIIYLVMIHHSPLVFFRNNVFGEQNSKRTVTVLHKIINRVSETLSKQLKEINDMYDYTSFIGPFTIRDPNMEQKSTITKQHELLSKLKAHPAVPVLTLEEEKILAKKSKLVRKGESIDKTILRLNAKPCKTVKEINGRAEALRKLEILRTVEAKIAKAESDYLDENLALLVDNILLPTNLFSPIRKMLQLASRVTGINLRDVLMHAFEYAFKWPDIYAALNEGIKKHVHGRVELQGFEGNSLDPNTYTRENPLSVLKNIFLSPSIADNDQLEPQKADETKKNKQIFVRYVHDLIDNGVMKSIFGNEDDFISVESAREKKAIFMRLADELINTSLGNEEGLEEQKELLLQQAENIIWINKNTSKEKEIVDGKYISKETWFHLEAGVKETIFRLADALGAETLKDIFNTLVDRLEMTRVYKYLLFSVLDEVVKVLKEEAKTA